MSQRTSTSAVETLLGGTAKVSNWDGVTSVQPYIDAATIFIDECAAGASSEGTPYSAGKAEMLERIMACHFYTKMDPVYQQRSTLGGSGGFVRDPKNPEPYKSMAIEMDTTGWVNAMLNRLVADGVWLGKVPSEQIPYDERD